MGSGMGGGMGGGMSVEQQMLETQREIARLQMQMGGGGGGAMLGMAGIDGMPNAGLMGGLASQGGALNAPSLGYQMGAAPNQGMGMNQGMNQGMPGFQSQGSGLQGGANSSSNANKDPFDFS
mmetsp:Transcript_56136/g.127475  ORF Transcript_56136/g.127475 Transcript_56136/m.127475 type:complete len:122 (-) Transcript_56136:509-874(-)